MKVEKTTLASLRQYTNKKGNQSYLATVIFPNKGPVDISTTQELYEKFKDELPQVGNAILDFYVWNGQIQLTLKELE